MAEVSRAKLRNASRNTKLGITLTHINGADDRKRFSFLHILTAIRNLKKLSYISVK